MAKETKTIGVKEIPQQEAMKNATNGGSVAIACRNDEGCGGTVTKDFSCFQGNLQGTKVINKCQNPGTPEAKCVVESKTGIFQQCSYNQFCRYGECVSFANCKDTDGGIVFDVKGKVTTNDGGVFEDKCKSDTLLIEYYCSTDHRAFTETKQCSCTSGACN